MTMTDFEREVQAHGERMEMWWELAAWMVAHLIRPHYKKAITPDQLLGKRKSSKGKRWA